mmetsp:Transcript_10471/g.26898  ORF Transcript_10471/g.26898 Transcript_10471/m.26898 type:complete len:681 (+) Transcript_10471:291-2333(+)
MAAIRVVPLGAGQDVGRSCVLVSIGGKNVMFDCGMHMGYNDERRFPDFSYIAKSGPLTSLLDAVIITHFHLDHCGALPYFSEMRGYDGPIFMTYPTKAIAPILLEDYRKITVEKKGETDFFTSRMIKDCMKKVITVDLHQTVQVDDELEIKAYYAGHVLGAAMFKISVGDQSVVYTGDYNMTPDRHLGAAWIDKCRPDVIITESTYATTIRDSKRCRERNFLKKVHDCVAAGGKVLIPVFALGRAQELCILLETYWERNNLTVPIYFSAGLTEKANNYYKLFISWTNQKIKRTFVERNMFEFKHILPFDRGYVDNPGPQVLFATPGMLHAGLSLFVFKRWAPNPKNMVIMPGYCVAGTVGAKVLSGAKVIEMEGSPPIHVRLSVEYLSFSAHADAKGIMQLIKQADAQNVVLVHGEARKMGFLAKKINKELGRPCYYPANGHSIDIHTPATVPIKLARSVLKRGPPVGEIESVDGPKRLQLGRVAPSVAAASASAAAAVEEEKDDFMELEADAEVDAILDDDPITEAAAAPAPDSIGQVSRSTDVEGILLMQRGEEPRLVGIDDAASELGMSEHSLSFASTVTPTSDDAVRVKFAEPLQLLGTLHKLLRRVCEVEDAPISFTDTTLQLRSVALRVGAGSSVHVSWSYADDELAQRVLTAVRREVDTAAWRGGGHEAVDQQ